MRQVIAKVILWTATGFLVTVGWGVYYTSVFGSPNPWTPTVALLSLLTQPAVSLVRHFDPGPTGLSQAAGMNAAT